MKLQTVPDQTISTFKLLLLDVHRTRLRSNIAHLTDFLQTTWNYRLHNKPYYHSTRYWVM
jgi:hypothetical protein